MSRRDLGDAVLFLALVAVIFTAVIGFEVLVKPSLTGAAEPAPHGQARAPHR